MKVIKRAQVWIGFGSVLVQLGICWSQSWSRFGSEKGQQLLASQVLELYTYLILKNQVPIPSNSFYYCNATYALIQWYLAESSLWSSSIPVIQQNRWYCNVLFQNLIEGLHGNIFLIFSFFLSFFFFFFFFLGGGEFGTLYTIYMLYIKI